MPVVPVVPVVPASAPTRARTLRAVLLAVSLPAAVGAQGVGSSLQFGVLGGTEWGRTNRNVLRGAIPDGSIDNAQFGLRITGAINDRISLSTLFVANEVLGVQQEQHVRYAFATVRLNRSFDLRIGRVKHPGSIYSEVFDVGTVRPFLSLPEAIYGPAGNSMESYTGAGLKGTLDVGPLTTKVDAYLGGGFYRYYSTRLDLLPGSAQDLSRIPARQLVGGRLGVSPSALPDLTVSAAAATFVSDVCQPSTAQFFCARDLRGRYLAGQLEYVTDRFSLRAELTSQHVDDVYDNSAHYIEAAAFITRQLHVAVQTNRLQDRLPDVPGAAPVPAPLLAPLDRHREAGVGLNWWFSPELVVKLSWSHIDGLRFASPGATGLQAGFATGRLPTTTRLLQAGMQFSY